MLVNFLITIDKNKIICKLVYLRTFTTLSFNKQLRITSKNFSMKNSYHTFLVFLFLLIYTQPTLGQNHSFTDKYNLNFNLPNDKNESWLIDRPYYFVLRVDSSQTIHGKNPLCFAQFKLGKSVVRLMGGTIQQKLLLPETKSDSATVFLNCKSKNLRQARLIITGISDQELILYSDTLSLLGSDDWKIFVRSVPLHDVRFLHLNIKAEGTKEVAEQRLYLDRIDLKINGKDINDFPLPTIPVISDIKKSDIISLSLSDSNSYNKISELENRKVVAIGETIHGSETITEAAVQLIKHQVEHNHCRLILLEISTELTFGWNRFIQGDTLFKIDNISQDLKLYCLSPRTMIDLCKWLKHYNEKVKDKVWLMGMDLDISSDNSALHLFNYIYKINEIKHQKLLDSLCLKLYWYNSFPQALQYLEKNKEIDNLLNKNEYEILRHCLNMSIACGDNIKKRFMYRDSLMYLNSTFLLNLLCPGDKNATIYTHFLHANYKTSGASLPFQKSFGSFMKNKFGTDYYTIAVLTGGGNFITGDKDSLIVKRTLKIPPVNSLEDLLIRTNEVFCFIPISTLPTQLIYSRFVGALYQENQFFIIAPASRMDAAIFVRNSKAFELLPGTPLSLKDSYMFESKQSEDHFKRYRQKFPIAKKNIKAVL